MKEKIMISEKSEEIILDFRKVWPDEWEDRKYKFEAIYEDDESGKIQVFVEVEWEEGIH